MAVKTFDPYLWNVEDLFKCVYDVPVYQRPYSWDQEQINVLLDDIFEAFKSESKDEGYYIGNIIVYDKSTKINGLITKYDIIDGQQRITSFSLILLALYTLSLSIGVSETDRTILKVKSALWKEENREFKKDFKSVTLNSIENKCFYDLYDYCFTEPTNIIKFCSNYYCNSSFEERVISNFQMIYERIRNDISANDQNEILDFADYILQYVQFIVIEANCSRSKVFSMFESINSKGKKLEDIDLIKTYIFSKLDEDSYDTYLSKWGELIIRTEDNLYDYLLNYVKAYISFYRQNINADIFKSISQRRLPLFFGKSSEKEALKKLLDDMCEKVEYYNMLSSAEKAYELVKNNKFRYYFKIFTEISYKHPKALFLRTLIEYKSNNISRDDVIEIFSETISFMMKTLSISNRDSKDVITMFSGIMSEIYKTNKVSKESIANAVASELVNQNITSDKLKDSLRSMDAYEKNKKITVALLALHASTSKDADGKFRISYDQAYTLLNSFGSAFSLDHLLVQTPRMDCDELKYYKDGASNILVLKEGHDFPFGIKSGMDYDVFTGEILNKIGNLRIYYKDKNSRRQNSSIELPEYAGFNSFADIEKRSDDIIDTVVDECLPMQKIDISQMSTNKRRMIDSGLPKMDKLIELGLINKGDQIYIIQKPKESVATLIDEIYVDYNGEKLTLNEWGCKITGWKSIRIYAYSAIVGETETLHEKRLRFLKFIEENND
jgi:uncharacterized protein with ParB-like and HNH nuclease domain